MNSSLNFYKLDENIFIYKNPFSDLGKISVFLNGLEWNPWYTFGDIYKIIKRDAYKSDIFPSKEDWSVYVNSLDLLNEEVDILNAFYSVTKSYTEETGTTLDNWLCSNIDICKYYDASKIADSDNKHSFIRNDRSYAMSFHTDYPQESSNSPGEKQKITCNMYLNSNYDGGEIEFKVFSDNGDFNRITYKPEAGDIVVFPSTPPYWHAVRETTNGEKYFVRCFWHVVDKASEDWVLNEEKYGTEIWKQMEDDRKKKERESGVHIRND